MQDSLVASGNNVTPGKRLAPCDRHSTRLWLLFRRLEAVREPKRRRKSHWPFIPKFYLSDIVENKAKLWGERSRIFRAGGKRAVASTHKTQRHWRRGAPPASYSTTVTVGSFSLPPV